MCNFLCVTWKRSYVILCYLRRSLKPTHDLMKDGWVKLVWSFTDRKKRYDFFFNIRMHFVSLYIDSWHLANLVTRVYPLPAPTSESRDRGIEGG